MADGRNVHFFSELELSNDQDQEGAKDEDPDDVEYELLSLERLPAIFHGLLERVRFKSANSNKDDLQT